MSITWLPQQQQGRQSFNASIPSHLYLRSTEEARPWFRQKERCWVVGISQPTDFITPGGRNIITCHTQQKPSRNNSLEGNQVLWKKQMSWHTYATRILHRKTSKIFSIYIAFRTTTFDPNFLKLGRILILTLKKMIKLTWNKAMAGMVKDVIGPYISVTRNSQCNAAAWRVVN